MDVSEVKYVDNYLLKFSFTMFLNDLFTALQGSIWEVRVDSQEATKRCTS